MINCYCRKIRRGGYDLSTAPRQYYVRYVRKNLLSKLIQKILIYSGK
nr:MAG TPA: hypothetical protein [Bacteriophage sp.]